MVGTGWLERGVRGERGVGGGGSLESWVEKSRKGFTSRWME